MGDEQKNIIKYYDLYSGKYAERWASIEPVKNDLEIFVKELNKRGKSDILDVGCGHGRDAKYFSDAGFSVIGIDLSSNSLDIARKRSPTSNFYLMDALKLNFFDATFDGIWSCTSLLHLDRAEMPAALKGLRRVIRDDGVLYLSLKKNVGKKEEYVTLPGEEMGRKFTYYALDEIDDLLTKAGFDMTYYAQKVMSNGTLMSIFCDTKK